MKLPRLPHRRNAPQPWSAERTIEAMIVFYRAHGRWPTRRDWPRAEHDHPSYRCIEDSMGSIYAAQRAASEALIASNYRPDPHRATGHP